MRVRRFPIGIRDGLVLNINVTILCSRNPCLAMRNKVVPLNETEITQEGPRSEERYGRGFRAGILLSKESGRVDQECPRLLRPNKNRCRTAVAAYSFESTRIRSGKYPNPHT
jgi:hypothetical protein